MLKFSLVKPNTPSTERKCSFIGFQFNLRGERKWFLAAVHGEATTLPNETLFS